jgi:hypothetical protein
MRLPCTVSTALPVSPNHWTAPKCSDSSGLWKAGVMNDQVMAAPKPISATQTGSGTRRARGSSARAISRTPV